MAGGEAFHHRRAALHGNADDAAIGFQGLRRQRHTRDKPTAGERHQQRLKVGRVLDDFETEGPLAGDDRLVIEGRDLDHALLAHQAIDLDLSIVLALADDADFGAERPDGADLVVGNQPGQADDRADACRLCGMRYGTAVIAGGGGDDAGAAGRFVERQHGIGGATQLEAAGGLLVFALDGNGLARPPRQPARRAQRRAQHVPPNAVPRLEDTRKRNHAGTPTTTPFGLGREKGVTFRCGHAPTLCPGGHS